MKKLFFAIMVATVLLSTAAFAENVVIGPQETEAKSFLLHNYGWTFDFSKAEKKFFGWSWDLTCSPKRVLPQEGVTAFTGVACIQKDKTFHTVVFWRVPTVKSAAVEKMVYNGMSEGLGYGKVTCQEESAHSAVAQDGVIRDCEVPLQNGTFFVSFYHFSVPMPADGSFVSNEGKRAETLNFTLWVQNAGNSDPAVKEKIRQLVSWIQVVGK